MPRIRLIAGCAVFFYDGGMSLNTDIRIRSVRLHFLPVETRVPLKFGPETLTYVTCARVAVEVERGDGRRGVGWGETPLSVQWVWPSEMGYEERHEALKGFCVCLVEAMGRYKEKGHALEVGHGFQGDVLGNEMERFNLERGGEAMPYLAGLVCCSAFDLALHDAFGVVNEVDIFRAYGKGYLSRDLEAYFGTGEREVGFGGVYPEDFLCEGPADGKLAAWHLVGGLDALDEGDLTGDEPDDGYPVMLREWIRTDGLKCLKVKLRGNDAAWDYDRFVRVGRIAIEEGVNYLSSDFNCTVRDVGYVNDILDRLRDEEPRIYGMNLYVEQPFPYDLKAYGIDTHSVSARKPLFLDESAHDWKYVRLGRELGWTGVALKTCKTQTGALLSFCWAKAHGMPLMVQDLTNPMLAQVPHCRLAAHVGTIMGVETNGMQFYPKASDVEAKVHPGLYRRRGGQVDLSTLGGSGFGYRVEEIDRELGEVAAGYE